MANEEDRRPPRVLGDGHRALEKVAELARQVLREKGFTEEQIDALLKRRYVRDTDR